MRRPPQPRPTPETIEPGLYIRNGYHGKVHRVISVNRLWTSDGTVRRLMGATVVTDSGVVDAGKFCRRLQRVWPDVDRWRRRRKS
jgi:hypothetical protein